MNKYRVIILSLIVSTVYAVETKAVSVLKIIGGDTIEVAADLGGILYPVRVRLLYVVTPKSRGDKDKSEIDNGKLAINFLASVLVPKAKVVLWSQNAQFERDKEGNLLAVVYRDRSPKMERDELGNDWPKVESVNESLVHAGFSPYWRKLGDAPDALELRLGLAEASAKEQQAGVWKTDPLWMKDMASDRADPVRSGNSSP